MNKYLYDNILMGIKSHCIHPYIARFVIRDNVFYLQSVFCDDIEIDQGVIAKWLTARGEIWGQYGE